MKSSGRCFLICWLFSGVAWAVQHQQVFDERFPDPIDLEVPRISSDSSVRFDYDIVYVRAPRKGDKTNTRWAEIANPTNLEPGSDLMLLHPDGSEEMIFDAGEGAVTDPVVSLDAQWVFFSYLPTLKSAYPGRNPVQGADIYKLHLGSKKLVRLTNQEFTPNSGAADWSHDFRSSEKGKTSVGYGVLNMGPCPLPGGRLVFTSSRDGFQAPKHPSPTMQLFVMDDDGRNVECIGHLNVGMALHPVVLKDGRIMFSSLESQGLRSRLLWGLWAINPDGTNWSPLISAFDPGGAPNAFHFQTQLSDGSIVAEEYYNQNNNGFGSYVKIPPTAPKGYAAFGPGDRRDPRNPPLRFGRFYNSKPRLYRLPFSPYGIESFTRFANNGEGEANLSVLGDKNSPRVGKFTHPSGAPDNHLLTVWSAGPINHQNGLKLPTPDAGIYLIKNGQPVDEPAEMRLIKNSSQYNEQWPRAVVPYRRIYGIDEPHFIPELTNDGKLSKFLPEGTPYGLIGTSSFYKRESYPEGAVPDDSVTSTFVGDRDSNGFQKLDPFNTSQNGASLNWFNQGSDAGRYSNDEIHAVRILAQEPTTARHRGPKSGRRFFNHAMERFRILGEIPLRKFIDGQQPLDPDGNPDTSFLARIPADVPFTFQTIDKRGMVLNMAQTWHQLRPGEVRVDCGGCHAHSQKPTDFKETFAARDDYPIFDLTEQHALLTTAAADQSGKQWDRERTTGLKFSDEVKNVEFYRDIKPILDRSCVPCHSRNQQEPAGNLVLDDDALIGIQYRGKVSGTYYRLAADQKAKFGHKPVIHNGSWRQTNASRYIRKFQSRRSLLIWKIFGERLDGWANDDFPSAKTPGDPETLFHRGKKIENNQRNRDRSDIDFTGASMPPVAAVKSGKVAPLSDEDKLTFVRWIDLGCPIDLDGGDLNDGQQVGTKLVEGNAAATFRGFGWFCDDKRPTLTMTYPKKGEIRKLDRILLGMDDYYSGLDLSSLEVRANFAVDGIQPGTNLAKKFKAKSRGVFELLLSKPVKSDEPLRLIVSVKDNQGNIAKIDRRFRIGR